MTKNRCLFQMANSYCQNVQSCRHLWGKKRYLFLIYKKATSRLTVALWRHFGISDLVLFRVKLKVWQTHMGSCPHVSLQKQRQMPGPQAHLISNHRQAIPGSFLPWGDSRLKLMGFNLVFLKAIADRIK